TAMHKKQSNPISTSCNNHLNIHILIPLVTLSELNAELSFTETAYQSVLHGRETIRKILDGEDKRLFVVICPCSIHDPAAAHEYAERLKVLSEKVKDSLYIVMRVYFEKTRNTGGR